MGLRRTMTQVCHRIPEAWGVVPRRVVARCPSPYVEYWFWATPLRLGRIQIVGKKYLTSEPRKIAPVSPSHAVPDAAQAPPHSTLDFERCQADPNMALETTVRERNPRTMPGCEIAVVDRLLSDLAKDVAAGSPLIASGLDPSLQLGGATTSCTSIGCLTVWLPFTCSSPRLTAVTGSGSHHCLPASASAVAQPVTIRMPNRAVTTGLTKRNGADFPICRVRTPGASASTRISTTS